MKEYRKIIRMLWPKHSAPHLRKKVIRLWKFLNILSASIPHYIWKLRHSGIVSVRVHGGLLYINSSDYRGRLLALTGGTQHEKIGVWRKLAEYNPDVAVDIGANYGEFIIALKGFKFKVIGFEANPFVYSCLKESFVGNEKITVLNKAISNKNGSVDFFFNNLASGSASIVKYRTEYINSKNNVASMSVPCQRLEDAIEEVLGNLPRSAIIKIDVEGAEAIILRDSLSFIKKLSWAGLLIEFVPGTVGSDTYEAAVNLWSALAGQRGFLLTERGYEQNMNKLQLLPEVMPTDECEVLVIFGDLLGKE